MRFFGGVIATFVVCSSLADAFCHDSISCMVGGDNVCNNVCVRQGNPNGGRCLPRDGCPGNDICACYPQSKRSDEVIDGDASIREVLKDFGIDGGAEKELNAKVKRSISCNFPDPFGGLFCENHCAYIGKPGGQCSDQKVCTCN